MDLHLSMITDETYPILQLFIKNCKIRIPNIYVTKEIFERIREIAGVKGQEYATEGGENEFEWDPDLSKKPLNVQKMMATLLDIPKETPKHGSDVGRFRALKSLKALIMNYLEGASHKAKFIYQPLTGSFEHDSDESFIGTFNRTDKPNKKK